MMQLDVILEESAWEQALQNTPEGGSFSAAELLTLLEGEHDDRVEDAVQLLADRKISLDLQGLDPVQYVGSGGQRLAQEERLVRQGQIPQGLEENDPLRLYLEEIAATPVAADPNVLAMRLAGGDRSVVENLLNAMLGTVVERAKEYVGKGVLLADLIQEASLGLWQSIQNYTEGDFFAHCNWWVTHYLASAVMLQARENGVGQKLRRALEDYRSVDEKLLADLGRNPTVEELAEALHMSVQETAAVSQMLESARILQHAKMPEPEQLPQEEDQAVEDTAYFQMRQRIEQLLSGVSEQDAQLLKLRYGLEGGLPMKPEQVAERLGLTPEEVTAKEAAVLAKLRQQN